MIHRPTLLYVTESTNWIVLSTVLFTGVKGKLFTSFISFDLVCKSRNRLILWWFILSCSLKYCTFFIAHIQYPSFTQLLLLLYRISEIKVVLWPKRLVAAMVRIFLCMLKKLHAIHGSNLNPYCHNRFSSLASLFNRCKADLFPHGNT